MKLKKVLNYFIRSFIAISGLSVASVSCYFGIGFFQWVGLNDFFSLIASIIVVGMMDALSQVAALLLKLKKYIAFSFVLTAWVFFLILSIFGTVIGMNEMIDQAKRERTEKAESRADTNPQIELLDKQIETYQKSIDSYQAAYDSELKKENPNWWILNEKYKQPLEQARQDQDSKIKERNALYDKLTENNKSQELLTNDRGRVDDNWKFIISIALGLVIDLSSCLILLFSWIFESKEIVEIKPEPKKKEKQIIPVEEKQQQIEQIKKVSFSDYVAMYYDCRVLPNNSLLQGRSCALGIPHNIYNKITKLALNLGFIKAQNTKMYIDDHITRDKFIKGIIDKNKSNAQSIDIDKF